MPFLRMARRRNWQELLSGGSPLSQLAIEVAEQDLLPDDQGYASVFEVTTQEERVETAVALCDG